MIAPPNDGFRIFSISWKGISSPKKDANHVKIGLEKKTLRLVEVIHYITDTVKLRKRDTKTENTLAPYADVCCSISTKLCTVVEEIGAII